MEPELDFIFHPKSIAVVGASPNPRHGNDFYRFLLEYPFKGTLYPVNPNVSDIHGTHVYPSVEDIPGPVDYVISAVGSPRVLELVDQCARKGVKVIHFYTARMRETGTEEGIKLEEDLLRKVKAAGIRIIGPNCMGIYYPGEGMTFKSSFPSDQGIVSVLSQSGGNIGQMVNLPALRGVRFGKVVSYGNAADLNECDFMEYMGEDPETKIISAYIEGVREGKRFFNALRKTAWHKPVIILKGGRTSAGTKAVASHTASMSGEQSVWNAMCRQTGTLSVSSMEEMADLMVAFTFLNPVKGTNVGLGGGGGGMSVQAADACEEAGLNVIPFPLELQQQLKERDPVYWEWIGNPIDVSILGASPLNFSDIMVMVADNPAFDVLICSLDEQWTLSEPRDLPRAKETIESFLNISKRTSKPFAVVMGADIPGSEWRMKAMSELRDLCVESNIAVFPTIGRAAKAIGRFVDYHIRRSDTG